MVVDADASVRDLVRSVLEHGGFEVRAVDDGESAISELERRPPDLVVTNLRLQNMSGNDLIGHIRSHRTLAGIPIMVLSGYVDSIPIDPAADAVIEKPFSPEELLRRADELTRRSRETS